VEIIFSELKYKLNKLLSSKSWIDTANKNRAVSWVQEIRYSEANLNLFRERTYIYRDVILLVSSSCRKFFFRHSDDGLSCQKCNLF
ncbi:unnamed protein product, partial [Schistosoma turkestanicum]